MTTVAILQPGFLPWLGFFDQMIRSDHFVYYDDVQFDKHGWRNRNRIKTSHGLAWLTVPVRHSGHHGQTIAETEIDHSRPWSHKMVRTIEQVYSRSPHCHRYSRELGDILCAEPPTPLLLDLDLRVIDLMRRWLQIDTPAVRSSTLGIEGGQSDRLVAICRHFGADRYLSGSAAKSYLQQELFDAAGISVVWQDYQHPVYRQLYGEFIPSLSALDLVLNLGPDSPKAIRGGQ